MLKAFIRMAPPILRREECGSHATMLFLISLYGFTAVLGGAAPAILTTPGEVILIVVQLLAMGLAVWSFASRCRKMTRIRADKWNACGCCGHTLGGLQGTCACPECGAAFDSDRLRAFWKRYVRMNLPGVVSADTAQPPAWYKRMASRVVVVSMIVFLSFGIVTFAVPMAPLVRISMVLLWGLTLWSLVIGKAAISLYICRCVIRNQQLVCLECGSCLDVADHRTACKRCGAEASLEHVRQQWDQWCPPCWHLEGIQQCR